MARASAAPLLPRSGSNPSRPPVEVVQGDILRVAIPADSVDLIVTSPPYGVDIAYATYDDAIPYDAYLEFSERWLARCREFLRPDGRLCLNVPLDKNKGGHQSVYADVLAAARRAGWKYFATVVWNEQNISRRTAWGSWRSASAPHVIAPVEMIALLYKDTWEKRTRGTSDISRDEFITWTNGVWTFGGETRAVGHPAPFPVELPRRCIKLFSYVGDTVLDPFAGSGSTLLACRATGRRGLGVEISPEYCALIRRRLGSEETPRRLPPPKQPDAKAKRRSAEAPRPRAQPTRRG